MATKDQKAWEEFQQVADEIRNTTENGIKINESATSKDKRIKELLDDFEQFCMYYFPRYAKARHGWFHKKGVKTLMANPKGFFAYEIPRGHAKSSIFGNFYPIYRLCRSIYLKTNEFTGLIKTSDNFDKACGLLADVQAELEFNARLTADYGKLKGYGSWTDGSFIDSFGNGYWAFGAGQSPRGARNGERRPCLIIVDDIDNDEIIKNPTRCQERASWVLEALSGCLDIGSKYGQVLLINNRIGRKSTVSYLVGDVEEGDPIREGIHHLKVYAIEHPKTHTRADFETGQPAWKEYLTLDMLRQQMATVGRIAFYREYFHDPFIVGSIFKHESFQFVQAHQPKRYDMIISYCDPSYKDTKRNDYKAIAVLGIKDREVHILECFCRQTTKAEMVRWHYEIWIKYRDCNAQHWIEGNFMQDTLLEEYQTQALEYGQPMPIRADTRSKPDKKARIETLTVHFERGTIKVNEAIRKDRDWLALFDQFLAFPSGHDDGPDAVEGAFYFIQTQDRSRGTKIMAGKFNNNRSRGW